MASPLWSEAKTDGAFYLFPPKFQTLSHTHTHKEMLWGGFPPGFAVMIFKKMSSRGKGAAEPKMDWRGGRAAWTCQRIRKALQGDEALGKPRPHPLQPRVCQGQSPGSAKTLPLPRAGASPGARGCQP